MFSLRYCVFVYTTPHNKYFSSAAMFINTRQRQLCTTTSIGVSRPGWGAFCCIQLSWWTDIFCNVNVQWVLIRALILGKCTNRLRGWRFRSIPAFVNHFVRMISASNSFSQNSDAIMTFARPLKCITYFCKNSETSHEHLILIQQACTAKPPLNKKTTYAYLTTRIRALKSAVGIVSKELQAF